MNIFLTAFLMYFAIFWGLSLNVLVTTERHKAGGGHSRQINPLDSPFRYDYLEQKACRDTKTIVD